MSWVEGLTNSQRILFTLANILCTSNKVLIKRWRKTIDGKAKDFELVNEGGTWKDKATDQEVVIDEFVEVMVPSTEVDKSKNWSLVYATGGSIDLTEAEVNLTSLSKWENVNGFDAKRIILKTETTPVDVNSEYDEYNTDPDSRVDSIEMFLEIVKYKNTINPEENLETTEHPITKEPLVLPNNHYIELRYGDKMEIEREYVVDIATRTEQTDKAVVNGQMCNKVPDPQVEGQFKYTPLSEEDAALYEAVIEYGDRLLSKEEGGHPCEFSKFSWYMDYKEQLIDELDGGPSSDDMSKGIKLMPQIIDGMSETIPVQFWINSNNDRVTMVLMGDPTIDYDKYLTSFAYTGKVDSFEGDGVVNDTAGNWALTVGSATIPCKKPKPLAEPLNTQVEILSFNSDLKNVLEISKTVSGSVVKDTESEFDSEKYLTEGYHIKEPIPSTTSKRYVSPIEYVDKFRVGYKFVTYSTDDETNPSADFDFVYANKLVDKQNPGAAGESRDSDGYIGNGWQHTWDDTPEAATLIDASTGTYSFKLKLPKTAKSLKVFKIDGNTVTNNPSMPSNYEYGASEPMYELAEIDLTVVPGVEDKGSHLEYTWIESDVNTSVPNDNSKIMPLSKTSGQDKSVKRDQVLGFVLDVNFPTTWGDKTTATGVNDISMFKTRSGVYNQRHYSAFITPEEYMRKDAFNPSRWTGKFHLSPTYVVHGYDGYRGWLKDTVIVDNTSIVHLDELIVNKDSRDKDKPQEIYKYFKLNAPFSFLNNSPNYNYGVGILKNKTYIDDKGNKIEIYD